MPKRAFAGTFCSVSLILFFEIFTHVASGALVLQTGRIFTGATYGIDSAALPPDAGLGVSSNHVAEFINGRYAVFSKSSQTRVQTMTDLSFWANAGVTIPSGSGVSDPRIIFDASSQRWFASMIDYDASGLNNRFLLAVSATADPTGIWRGVAFAADPVNGSFADFPTLGIDASGVYLAGDMSDASLNNTGSTLVSIPKIDLLANPPSIARRTSFGLLSYGSYGVILQPIVTLGPASSTEAVLATGDLGYDGRPHSTLVGAAIQNVVSSGAASLGSPATIHVPQYVIPLKPPQPGAADNIDGGDARFSAFVYRVGDVLYATHSTEVNNRAAIQWFKIDAPTLSLLDTGIITDPVLDLFYPAIAANTNGTVMLAFNGSSATNFVSCYAVLGEPINGSLTFGNFVLLKAGVASYRTNSTLTRWGDYSAVSPDPADPSHFWALTMYPSSTTAWSTRITELIAGPLLLSITTQTTNVLLSWSAAAAGYQLQSSPSPSPGSWGAVPQIPTTNNNNQFIVSLGITNAARFFRLIK